jgi:hypothetical protein
VHIYTQTVQQYSAHLHTNSTAVQYTFTHKQYSSTVHIHTQTVQPYSTHSHTNSTQNIKSGTYITIKRKKLGSARKCGPCPVFASYILAFALQLRIKHGKTSVRVVDKCPDIPVAVDGNWDFPSDPLL